MENIERDLKFLVRKWPKLKKYVKNDWINLREKDAIVELQKAIAYAYYNIILLTPQDNLVPMVNNRIRYLLFIQKIISNIQAPVLLDIGTGSSCIYPLLGCRIFKKSRWFGTEVSCESIQIANISIKRNALEDRITILKASKKEFFTGTENVDFVMTNPPFYSTKQELEEGFLFKDYKDVTVGMDSELYTDGGEYEFVKRMIQEGLDKKLEMWMSSMMGKKVNFIKVLKVLKDLQVRDIKTESFQLGKTKRWLVAWRFNTTSE
jgi:23S rRNA (adenine1618-N6)-methyltransferase